MGDRFELRGVPIAGPRANVPRLAARVALALSLVAACVHVPWHIGFFDRLESLLHSLESGAPDWQPYSIATLSLFATAAVFCAGACASIARTLFVRRRARDAAHVVADVRGLVIDGEIAIARDAIASAHVTPLRDGGFAVVIARAGAPREEAIEIPVESEERAKAMLVALGLEGAPMVFADVDARRGRTLVAMALFAIAASYVLFGPRFAIDFFHVHRWLQSILGAGFARAFFTTYSPALVAPLVALCAAFVARRRAPSVSIDRDGIRPDGPTGALFPYESIDHVDTRDADVDIVLRDGHSIALRFADGRPVAERDLLVDRVRVAVADFARPSEPEASGPRVRVGAAAAEDEALLAEDEPAQERRALERSRRSPPQRRIP